MGGGRGGGTVSTRREEEGKPSLEIEMLDCLVCVRSWTPLQEQLVDEMFDGWARPAAWKRVLPRVIRG